jgi:hypothetical protein
MTPVYLSLPPVYPTLEYFSNYSLVVCFCTCKLLFLAHLRLGGSLSLEVNILESLGAAEKQRGQSKVTMETQPLFLWFRICVDCIEQAGVAVMLGRYISLADYRPRSL